MTDEPEIKRCVCGLPGRVVDEGGAYYVDCPAFDEPPYPENACWIGPTRTTREAALTEWGALMRAAKERARLQAEVATAHDTYMAYCHCPDCTEHRARVKETTT